MEPKQAIAIQDRVDQEVMAVKGLYTFSKAPGLEPHYQILFSVISNTLIG